MKIKLKKLSLLNFQGIRNLEIDFSDRTDILGYNAAGKTTVLNAFTWLMFGKDAQDRQQFELKTLDANNQVIPKLNHEVKGIIEINGTPTELKRVLREKWVKKRGESELRFEGNTEDYFIDRVPMSKTDYQKAISDIIREDQFKLITSPLYFNSVMDWKTRREMLFRMAGDTTYAEVAEKDVKLEYILPDIEKKSIEGFKKQLAADKKAIRGELDQITPRIDEQSRTMPKIPDVDSINARIAELNEELEGINGNLEAINNANKQRQETLKLLYDQVNQLNAVKQKIKTEAINKADSINAESQNKINTIKNDIENKKIQADGLKGKIALSLKEIKYLEEQNNVLRNQIEKLNDETPDFSQVQEECPTCKRPFNPEDVEGKREDIERAFNEESERKFNNLQNKGIANNKEIKTHSENIDNWRKELSVLESEINDLIEKYNSVNVVAKHSFEEYLDKEQIAELDKKIASVNEEINKPRPGQDDEQEQIRKSEILKEIDKLKDELTAVKIIEGKKARIKELEESARDLSQQLAEIEKKEYLVELFNRTYITSIEDKINSMFGHGVKFRMFREQINGGETEDCTLIVGGVPWHDLNSAGKIQAGIACINSISMHFGYNAPVFVDNAETIITLPETESQLIRLIVSENHKELTVSNS